MSKIMYSTVQQWRAKTENVYYTVLLLFTNYGIIIEQVTSIFNVRNTLLSAKVKSDAMYRGLLE